jgi:hypothetical protein
MAISTGSPFGKLTGKLGSAIGFSWKNKNAVRSYAIPANPRTEAQQAVRLVMARLVRIAKQILDSVIHKFWNIQATGMSGYNFFLKSNIPDMNGIFTPGAIHFSTGALEAAPLIACNYRLEDGHIEITWDKTICSNGSNNDLIVFVAYDEVYQMTYVFDIGKKRSDEHIESSIPADLDFNHLHGYVFAYRLDNAGKISMVSPTSYHIFSEL